MQIVSDSKVHSIVYLESNCVLKVRRCAQDFKPNLVTPVHCPTKLSLSLGRLLYSGVKTVCVRLNVIFFARVILEAGFSALRR